MNLALSIVIIISTLALTKLFCVLAHNTRLMDKPNSRSSHVTPTVRGGGLVFITVPLFALLILCYRSSGFSPEIILLMVSIVLIAAVSLWDDLYTLSVKPRFLAQAFVALLISVSICPEQLNFGLFSLSNPLLVIPFTCFTLIWAINHFNFMDGLDGICAIQAIFIFVAYALLFNFAHATLYHDLCVIFVCSLLGFLVFNFPPATLFMGDVGSATLGLIVFCIALIGQQSYHIPIIYWFMLNALFLFDATTTLVRRFINKEQWSAPHKKHAYQRLKQYGFTTRVILLGQIACNSVFLILVLLVHSGLLPVAAAIAVQLCILVTLYSWVEKKFPMFKQT